MLFSNHYLCVFLSLSLSLLFSHSQPSSCLSDKEEDEIYGFGYGVFAPRVARGALQATTTANVHHHNHQPICGGAMVGSSGVGNVGGGGGGGGILHPHAQQAQTLHHPQAQTAAVQHHQQQLIQHHGSVPAGQQRCLFRHNFIYDFPFVSFSFVFI